MSKAILTSQHGERGEPEVSEANLCTHTVSKANLPIAVSEANLTLRFPYGERQRTRVHHR